VYWKGKSVMNIHCFLKKRLESFNEAEKNDVTDDFKYLLGVIIDATNKGATMNEQQANRLTKQFSYCVSPGRNLDEEGIRLATWLNTCKE
jgi:hypothetical protein